MLEYSPQSSAWPKSALEERVDTARIPTKTLIIIEQGIRDNELWAMLKARDIVGCCYIASDRHPFCVCKGQRIYRVIRYGIQPLPHPFSSLVYHATYVHDVPIGLSQMKWRENPGGKIK